MKDGQTLTRALLFVHIPTHFSELVRVVELLSNSGRYRPVVMFAAMYTGVERDIERCKALGATVVTEPELRTFREASLSEKVRGRFASSLGRIVKCSAGALRRTLSAIVTASRTLLSLLPTWMTKGAFAAPISRSYQGLVVAVRWLLSRGHHQLNSSTHRFNERSAKHRPRSIALSVFLAPAAALAWLLRSQISLLHRFFYRIALAMFGIWYHHFSPFLPPDIRALQHIQKALPALLNEHDIRLLVLPEDNFYYFTNFYVKAVHERGGAAIVVPFTIVNMLEWAEAFYKEPSHNAELPLNSVMALLFPRWLHSHRNRRLVMPFQQILCNEYFGTAPPVPWLINSGHTDAIAVESSFMHKYYLRAGIQENRLCLTGALYDDAIHYALTHASTLREKLYTRLNLRPGLPMLLCALPPNQLAGGGRVGCDFSEYTQLLQAFLLPLSRLSDTHNCVLSLHPRIDPSVVDALDLGPIRVAMENVADLVPLSHLYIASCSATIRLAINCGVPVVNYDVYRYNYDDYTTIPGVLTTEENSLYQQAIAMLCTDSKAYADSREQLQSFAAEHAILDGQAGKRLLALIDEVLASKSH